MEKMFSLLSPPLALPFRFGIHDVIVAYIEKIQSMTEFLFIQKNLTPFTFRVCRGSQICEKIWITLLKIFPADFHAIDIKRSLLSGVCHVDIFFEIAFQKVRNWAPKNWDFEQCSIDISQITIFLQIPIAYK